MEVEYLSEMSESLYQNTRCHIPHHRNTETTNSVTGLLNATRFRLEPQATLFGQEPNKSANIHWAVRVLR
jgi:hypothetical protein